MEDDSDENYEPDSKVEKKKLFRSCVHELYEITTVYHLKKKEEVKGRMCKICKVKLCSSTTSNLKKHLELKHITFFQKVQAKDKKAMDDYEGVYYEDNDEEDLLADLDDSNCLNVGKLPFSSVHEYFEDTMVFSKKREVNVKGRKCKLCGSEFLSVSSSNLKSHLQCLHPEVYLEVKAKDEELKQINISKSIEELHHISKVEEDSLEWKLDDYEEIAVEDESSTIGKEIRRVSRSCVHDVFEPTSVFHPVKQKHVEGSKCKVCGSVYTSKFSSNLKQHLKTQHKDMYEKVMAKDREALFRSKEENESSDEEDDDFLKEIESSTSLKAGKLNKCFRSSVHEYFENTTFFSKRKQVNVVGKVCKLCGDSFHSSQVTNLKYHLMRKHNEIYLEVKAKDEDSSIPNPDNGVEDLIDDEKILDDEFDSLSSKKRIMKEVNRSKFPSMEHSYKSSWKNIFVEHLRLGDTNDGSLNVKISCKDGTILTHKLVLASISSMMYEAMTNINSDETCQILMPDFTAQEAEKYFVVEKECSPDIDMNEGIDVPYEHDDTLTVKDELEETSIPITIPFTFVEDEPVEKTISAQNEVIPEVKRTSTRKDFNKKFIWRHFSRKSLKKCVCLYCEKEFSDLKPSKTINLRLHILKFHNERINDEERRGLHKFFNIENVEVYRSDGIPNICKEKRKKMTFGKRAFFKQLILNHCQISDDEEHYMCKYCDKKNPVLKSTTEPRHHLLKIHPEVLNEEEKENMMKYGRTDVDKLVEALANKNLLDPSTGVIKRSTKGIRKRDVVFETKTEGATRYSIKRYRAYVWNHFSFAVHDKTKVVCQTCHEEVDYNVTVSAMNTHLVRVHPELLPDDLRSEVICSICGKYNTSRYKRDLCEAKHKKKVKFRCEHCDKGFYDKGCLTKHIRVHTGEKPFKCSDCDQCFKTRSHLKTHYDGVHLGLLKFECEFCLQRFKWMACRNTHSKTCSMKI